MKKQTGTNICFFCKVNSDEGNIVRHCTIETREKGSQHWKTCAAFVCIKCQAGNYKTSDCYFEIEKSCKQCKICDKILVWSYDLDQLSDISKIDFFSKSTTLNLCATIQQDHRMNVVCFECSLRYTFRNEITLARCYDSKCAKGRSILWENIWCTDCHGTYDPYWKVKWGKY